MTDLREDERVIREATAGPWLWLSVGGWDAVCEEQNTNSVICRLALNHPSNAAFIVRARTRWPELVREVLELRELAIFVMEECIKELQMISRNEQCDHSVNICWCSTFYVIDMAQKAKAKLKVASRSG